MVPVACVDVYFSDGGFRIACLASKSIGASPCQSGLGQLGSPCHSLSFQLYLCSPNPLQGLITILYLLWLKLVADLPLV